MLWLIELQVSVCMCACVYEWVCTCLLPSKLMIWVQNSHKWSNLLFLDMKQAIIYSFNCTQEITNNCKSIKHENFDTLCNIILKNCLSFLYQIKMKSFLIVKILWGSISENVIRFIWLNSKLFLWTLKHQIHFFKWHINHSKFLLDLSFQNTFELLSARA